MIALGLASIWVVKEQTQEAMLMTAALYDMCLMAAKRGPDLLMYTKQCHIHVQLGCLDTEMPFCKASHPAACSFFVC